MMERLRATGGRVTRGFQQAARLAMIAAISGCGSDPGEHQYSAGFTLTLPTNWELREDYRDMPLVALAPVDDAAAFPVNLNVRLVGNPDGLSIEEFYAQHFDEEIARSVHEDFALLDVSDRDVRSHPARRVVYTHRIAPDDLKSVAWLVLASRRGYIITGNATIEQFASYEAAFDQIAMSLNID